MGFQFFFYAVCVTVNHSIHDDDGKFSLSGTSGTRLACFSYHGDPPRYHSCSRVSRSSLFIWRKDMKTKVLITRLSKVIRLDSYYETSFEEG